MMKKIMPKKRLISLFTVACILYGCFYQLHRIFSRSQDKTGIKLMSSDDKWIIVIHNASFLFILLFWNDSQANKSIFFNPFDFLQK